MLTQSQIVDRLRTVGLSPGDTVLVHSSLRQIGPLENGADTLIDALLEAVGPSGHVAMPTFNGIVTPYFDPATSVSTTGALTEVFRHRPGVVRSLHPTHSLCVAGPDAQAITAEHLACDTLGVGSPIDRLADRGGYVLLLGVSHTSNTTVHVAESHANVHKFYRDPEHDERNPPIARVLMPDGSVVDHKMDPTGSCSFAFNAVDAPLRTRDMVRDFDLGRALCMCMRASDIIRAVGELLHESPDILFCTRANCYRCRRGREHALANRHD